MERLLAIYLEALVIDGGDDHRKIKLCRVELKLYGTVADRHLDPGNPVKRCNGAFDRCLTMPTGDIWY